MIYILHVCPLDVIDQPGDKETKKIFHKCILAFSVLSHIIQIKLHQAFFKAAVQGSMFRNTVIVNLLQIGLLVGKMYSGIINQFGNQAVEFLYLVDQKIVI